MANGKSTWKYNKLLTARRNYFALAGQMNTADPLDNYGGNPFNTQGYMNNIHNYRGDAQATQAFVADAKNNGINIDTSKAGSLGPDSMFETKESGNTGAGMVAGIAGLATQATSDILGIFNAKKEVQARANSLIANAKAQQMGAQARDDNYDALNEDWKKLGDIADVTKKQLGYNDAGKVIGDSFSGAARGAAAGAGLGPWGMLGGAIGGQLSSLITSGIRNREAKKQAARVNEYYADLNDYKTRALVNRGINIGNDVFSNLNSNYAAFGGELNIKGADFSNGLLQVNAGGSHEMNPNEGVPMGVDQEGTPNLVEEGETIYNDYVYSKRLKVPKGIRRKYKLGGKKPISFAEASKKLAKESEERPNDPISKRGLEAFMEDLAQSQEDLKMKQQIAQMAKMAQMQGLPPEGAMPPEGMEMSPDAMGQIPQDIPMEGMEGMAAFGGKLNKFKDGGVLKQDAAKLKALGYDLETAKRIMMAAGETPLSQFSDDQIRDMAEGVVMNDDELEVSSSPYGDQNGWWEQMYEDTNPNAPTPQQVKWTQSYGYGESAPYESELYKDWANFKFGDRYLYSPTYGYAEIYTDPEFKAWIDSEAGRKFRQDWWSNEENAPNYYTPKETVITTGKGKDAKKEIVMKKNTIPTYEDLMKGMYDTKFSDMHKFGMAALEAFKQTQAEYPDAVERYLREYDKKGNYIGATDITNDWWEGVNDDGLFYLGDKGKYKDRYEFSRTGRIWDEDNKRFVQKYYYEDKHSNKPNKNHLVQLRDRDNNVIGDPFSYTEAMKQGALNGYSITGETYPDEDGNDVTVYRQDPEKPKKFYADFLRYAPILGSAVSVGMDALGLANNPDYRNADSLGDYAAKSTGQFQPISYNPIGNYLTYKPFDQQYAVNNLNAQAAASRRAITQTAGLNRGAGISGILAADYNNMNQLGELYSKAAQYNEALKKDIETFNRETNQVNSEGKLKADMSNQENRMKGWEVNANLAYQAADMREKARLAAEQAKSTNFSGLFTNIGNLGSDEYTRRQQDWGLWKGIWGNGSQDFMNFMRAANELANSKNRNSPTNNTLQRQAVEAKKGGKIKRRRKGLTF